MEHLVFYQETLLQLLLTLHVSSIPSQSAYPKQPVGQTTIPNEVQVGFFVVPTKLVLPPSRLESPPPPPLPPSISYR